MIDEKKAPNLLSLFSAYIESTYINPYAITGRQNFPLDCYVSATDPTFIASDMFNSITCEFVKDSYITFKKENPRVKLTSLTNKSITIKQYKPHISLLSGKTLNISLRIISFSLSSLSFNVKEKPTYLTEDPSMKPLLEIARIGIIRQEIQESNQRDELPLIETVFSAPHLGPCSTLVIQHEEFPKNTEPIINYNHIKDIEQETYKRVLPNKAKRNSKDIRNAIVSLLTKDLSECTKEEDLLKQIIENQEITGIKRKTYETEAKK